MTDLDAIREQHAIGPSYQGQDYCERDGEPWPCDTAVVLAALWERELSNLVIDRERQRDAARANANALAEALRLHHTETLEGQCACGHVPCDGLAALAAHDALIKLTSGDKP